MNIKVLVIIDADNIDESYVPIIKLNIPPFNCEICQNLLNGIFSQNVGWKFNSAEGTTELRVRSDCALTDICYENTYYTLRGDLAELLLSCLKIIN